MTSGHDLLAYESCKKWWFPQPHQKDEGLHESKIHKPSYGVSSEN